MLLKVLESSAIKKLTLFYLIQTFSKLMDMEHSGTSYYIYLE